jgi:hypothetical protein
MPRVYTAMILPNNRFPYEGMIHHPIRRPLRNANRRNKVAAPQGQLFVFLPKNRTICQENTGLYIPKADDLNVRPVCKKNKKTGKGWL